MAKVNLGQVRYPAEDTGEIALTAYGANVTAGSTPPKIRKINDIVNVFGAFKVSSNLTWGSVLCTIPTGYRPASEINCLCRVRNVYFVAVLAVLANGQLQYLHGVPEMSAPAYPVEFMLDIYWNVK